MWVRLVVLALPFGVILALPVLTAAPALAQAPPTGLPATSAGEIVRRVRAGDAIDLSGVTVVGDVDLRGVGVVSRPFRCVGCHFQGAIYAPDAIFERAVDLSLSFVAGAVDLTGSVFKDHGIFDRVKFFRPFAASSARMLDGFSFVRAHFYAPATFDRARVKGQATFVGSTFYKDVNFRGVQLEGASNFGQAIFTASRFQDAFFGGRANFSLTLFDRDTYFNGAQLAGGGTFRAAEFHGSATFDHLSAANELSFDGATFRKGGNFFNVVTSGSLSFSGIDLREGELYITDLVARDLFMDVELIVKGVHGFPAKWRLLDQVEKTAQARKALPEANRARFVRMSLLAEEKRGVERLLDGVYRDVCGYFVRPRRPFVAFWLLVFAAGLTRTLPKISAFWSGLVEGKRKDRIGRLRRLIRTPVETRPATGGPSPGLAIAPPGTTTGAGLTGGAALAEQPTGASSSGRGIRARARAACQFLYPILHSIAIAADGWAKSLSSAFGRKPDVVLERRDGPEYARAVVRWVEFLVYKGLIAVFLLALSNSNATLRQIVDNAWKT
jgi:hypothetical protein